MLVSFDPYVDHPEAEPLPLPVGTVKPDATPRGTPEQHHAVHYRTFW